jgi:pyrroline-5-carboxylate reductase
MACKLGFIGTGNMGGALIRSIAAGDKRNDFIIKAYDADRALLERLAGETGIKAGSSVRDVVEDSDIIVLAVKPQQTGAVLEEMREAFGSGAAPRREGDKILVSIAVGLPISYYKGILGENAGIVRAMPNTPALVGEGMTLICCGDGITPNEKNLVMNLLSFSGLVEELDEGLMSEVTALTGSSPAYVFMFIEAMADAAVQSGIPRKLAYRLASQAVLGSAKLARDSGKHPGELKDMVCSPAGTTIEAVAALERLGFRNAVITAMGECTRRAREIGKKYSG